MKIVVIGEKCVDEFIYGECTRLNPEAPTPVFIEKNRVIYDGMASNVTKNLESIEGVRVNSFHQKNKIVKTRFVDSSSNYILLRVDDELDVDEFVLTDDIREKIISCDLLVVSDYDKGYLNTQVLKDIAIIAPKSIIDTKKAINPYWANHYSFLKMNKKEWDNPLHIRKEDYLWNTIITQGKSGAVFAGEVFSCDKSDVIDVVGAGDSFLAGFSYMYVKTNDIKEAIRFANKTASEAVKIKGVSNEIKI